MHRLYGCIVQLSFLVIWTSKNEFSLYSVLDSTYFKLRVNTQAGTYVKEFVHGDFGRTRPNIGELLGGVTADCLALDVEVGLVAVF